jgi:hypothetical protein
MVSPTDELVPDLKQHLFRAGRQKVAEPGRAYFYDVPTVEWLRAGSHA